jgi:hypothetical protein
MARIIGPVPKEGGFINESVLVPNVQELGERTARSLLVDLALTSIDGLISSMHESASDEMRDPC